MTPRARIATLAMLVACGRNPEQAPTPPAPPPRVVHAPVADVAAPDDPRARRLASYLALMSVDFVFDQLLATFPGAPATNRFGSYEYRWGSQREHSLGPLAPTIAVAAAAAGETPRAPVDTAVAAYLAALMTWWPKIESLASYYADERFVDDEFARARREAPVVERARTELARLRGPMRAAVLAAWRDLTHDAPGSPRAIIGRSWEACIAYADRVMARSSADAIDAAISRCRRAIAPVAALPATLRDHLDDKLRRVAIEAGDDAIVHQNLDAAYALGALTAAYVAQWHALASIR
jgi:hypothetical protein